jgi:hypothetical protein
MIVTNFTPPETPFLSFPNGMTKAKTEEPKTVIEVTKDYKSRSTRCRRAQKKLNEKGLQNATKPKQHHVKQIKGRHGAMCPVLSCTCNAVHPSIHPAALDGW